MPGLYAVGWIKRGPSGVIGTNKKDAQETVDNLFADLEAGTIPEAELAADRGAIEALLDERKPDHVTFEGWQAIDAAEVEAGKPHGRPRVKLCRVRGAGRGFEGRQDGGLSRASAAEAQAASESAYPTGSSPRAIASARSSCGRSVVMQRGSAARTFSSNSTSLIVPVLTVIPANRSGPDELIGEQEVLDLHAGDAVAHRPARQHVRRVVGPDDEAGSEAGRRCHLARVGVKADHLEPPPLRRVA